LTNVLLIRLTFKFLSVTFRAPFLNISGYGPIIDSPSFGIFWTLSFWFNESGYLEASNSPDHNLTVFDQNPTQSQTRHITLQVAELQILQHPW